MELYFQQEPMGAADARTDFAEDFPRQAQMFNEVSIVTNANCGTTVHSTSTHQAWHQVMSGGLPQQQDMQSLGKNFTGDNGPCVVVDEPIQTTNPDGGGGKQDVSFDSVWYLCMIRTTYVNGVEVSSHVLWCNQM